METRKVAATTSAGLLVVVALASGAAGCGFPPDEAAPVTETTPFARRLTDWPGREDSPRYSPDGRLVAFEAEVDGQTDLYLLSRSDGVIRRLTDSPSLDRRPAWSPDGRSIAFQSNRSGRWAIWRVEIAGGSPRLVFGGEDVQAIAPDWSPDGRLVATVIEPDASRSYGRTRPWLLSLDGGGSRPLTAAGDEWYARWDPAGEWLVYYIGTGDEIQAVHAVSGEIRSLSRGEYVGWRPAPSPDGGRLAFISSLGRWSLWIASRDEPARQRRLTVHSEDDMPSWSPDGRSVVYSSDRSSAEVMALELETGRRTLLVKDAESPQPLADGRLAYLSEGLEGWRLTVESADGAERREVPTPPGGLVEFEVAPDGHSVAYVAMGKRPRGSYDLYRTDLVAGGSRRLTVSGESESPAWCVDGSILFSSHGTENDSFRQVWRIPAEEEVPHQVTRSRRSKRPLQCSAGRHGITVRLTSGSSGLYAVDAGGRLSAAPLAADATEGRWSPDGERFAYVAVVEGQTDLFVRQADGATTRLTDDALVEQSVRWGPDSRRLVFTVRSSQRDLWEIDVPPLFSPNGDERPMLGGDRMPRSTTVRLGVFTLLILASWSKLSTSFAQKSEDPVGEPPRSPLEIRPHGSPDRTRIAIVKDFGEEGARNYDLHVIHADGTRLRSLLA